MRSAECKGDVDMCQAKVILLHNEKSETIMEDVTHLKVEGEKVWLSRFFEPPTALRAVLKEADFLKHTVILVPLEGNAAE
jgi:predicted RNA-binding protein